MKAKKIALIVAVTLAIVVSLGFLGLTMEAQQTDLTSTYIRSPLPVTDPNSPLWSRAAESKVALGSQTVIQPMKLVASTPYIRVRSLNNGTHIAFLVTWSDVTKNDRAVKTEEFRDAVAVLLAAPGQEALLAMGIPTQPVEINHWKGDWQTDIEKGFQDLQSAFPNFWVDVYPSAVGAPPYNLPEAFPENARIYLPGWKVGNILSQPLRVTPVEQATAKGFGSLATQPQQDSIGRGLWENGEWKVVIARKMNTGDTHDISLTPAGKYATAFAVWEGASGDVGARKSISALLTIYIQG